MAQHDYSLANQSGSAFRSDLNNALAAIVSQNSGSAEPITKYAYQYWIDTSTTPALIKQRNAANSGWITLGEVDGQTLAADGTVAKPGISFAADIDTGLRRNAADDISIVTGGTQAITVGSLQNVGIGTTDPEARIHSRADGDEIKALLYLQNKNSGGSAGSQISFSNSLSDQADNRLAYIRSLTTGASQNGNHLIFGTNPSGGDSAERVRITSSGNVGIGTIGPAAKLQIQSSNSDTPANAFAVRQNNSADTAQATFSVEASPTDGVSRLISSATSTPQLAFYAGSSEALRIDSSGNVGIATSSPGAKLEVNGSLSKSSGSFKIDHPLPALAETHHLVHSFVEAPDASNLYAGMVDLVDGTATVNIDTAHRMTEGTFEALNTIQSWSSSNESGYAPVKCSISGNLLTIECQDPTSTDTVYYEVRGIRKDQHMLDTEWTDENGRVITEPSKAAESNDQIETLETKIAALEAAG